MTKYILKRIVGSLITLFIVITATFFLMRFMPGGPFTGEKKLDPAIQKNLEATYGLDKPLLTQYGMYLEGLTHGDLGPSLKYKGRDVSWIIKSAFPRSAKLGSVAVVLSLVIGVFMGIISALNYKKWPDKVTMVLSTLGVTLPSFVIGTLLMYIFALKLKLLPTTGLSTWKHYIMPSIALAGSSIAFISRLSRSRLVDVMKSDFIRTAKAKGLSKNKIIYKHALRNSLIPIVTYLGPLVAGILTGSFVIEKIFAIPGLGGEFVTTITNRDYTTILGVTLFYSAFLIISNLIVDILYVIIDPRIKLDDVEA